VVECQGTGFTIFSHFIYYLFYLFYFIYLFIFTEDFFPHRFHGSNGTLEPFAAHRKHGPINGKDRLIGRAVETAGEVGEEPEIVYLSAA
jgi:hypothetical protein